MSDTTVSEIPPHVESKMWQLRRWANRLRGRYGVPIYLCGSALRADNPDPRDWDVRITMPDDEFALRFGPVDQWRDEGCTGQWTRTRYRWSDQCVKDTKDFNAWMHLPGDVQIYPESHVAAVYADLPRLRIDTFPDGEDTDRDAELAHVAKLAEHGWDLINGFVRDLHRRADEIKEAANHGTDHTVLDAMYGTVRRLRDDAAAVNAALVMTDEMERERDEARAALARRSAEGSEGYRHPTATSPENEKSAPEERSTQTIAITEVTNDDQ